MNLNIKKIKVIHNSPCTSHLTTFAFITFHSKIDGMKGTTETATHIVFHENLIFSEEGN